MHTLTDNFLLGHVLQTVTSADLKEHIFAPLGAAFSNATLMKATLGDARGQQQQLAEAPGPGDPLSGPHAALRSLARRVRCSAFNASAALVAATQNQAKFYLFPLEVCALGICSPLRCAHWVCSRWSLVQKRDPQIDHHHHHPVSPSLSPLQSPRWSTRHKAPTEASGHSYSKHPAQCQPSRSKLLRIGEGGGEPACYQRCDSDGSFQLHF